MQFSPEEIAEARREREEKGISLRDSLRRLKVRRLKAGIESAASIDDLKGLMRDFLYLMETELLPKDY